VTGDAALDALRRASPSLIVVGASAGAVDVLSQLLPALAPPMPAAMVVVVHVPADRPSALPALLSGRAAVPVVEAEDKMNVQAGRVYFAPPDYHLLVERDGALALSTDEPVLFSRPSIDVLFESAALAAGRDLLGILLSGASADGARGLAAIRAHGGLTWVQRPESAAVSTMPLAALEMAPHPVLDPADMAGALRRWSAGD
jgi:two-component system, chemotaxis family, protein-glutamate methylesterase/glutaminase